MSTSSAGLEDQVDTSIGPFQSIPALASRYRYELLCLPLLALLAWHVATRTWGSDFWGHVAVIRELAAHPLHPRHPQLPDDLPHAFFSPYAVVLGLASRITGLDPASILPIGGLFNLLLFLSAFRPFVALVSPAGSMPFYSLLFVLFLWGPSPWNWSGFFNFRSFGDVLPFPSTFAMALALLAVVGSDRFLERRRVGNLLLLPVLFSVVFLTHAITSLFMLVGLAGVAVSRYRPNLRRPYALLLGALLLGLLVASVWPYYSFPDLLLSASPHYDDDQQEMYSQVPERIFPALIGLPFLVGRLKSSRRDLPGLIFITASLLYAYGWISGSLRYGRMISYAVLGLQLAAAAGIIRMKLRPPTTRIRRLGQRLTYAAVSACLILSVADSAAYLVRNHEGSAGWADGFQFLRSYTGQYDLILSDLDTSNVVPAFGGKVVAASRFLAFVPSDYEVRKRDVEGFFRSETTLPQREEVLRKYGVDWLLVDREAIMGTGASMGSLRRLGRVVYEDRARGLVLIKMEV
jgi:hypothetical protein